jgi:hypothetical protein
MYHTTGGDGRRLKELRRRHIVVYTSLRGSFIVMTRVCQDDARTRTLVPLIITILPFGLSPNLIVLSCTIACGDDD